MRHNDIAPTHQRPHWPADAMSHRVSSAGSRSPRCRDSGDAFERHPPSKQSARRFSASSPTHPARFTSLSAPTSKPATNGASRTSELENAAAVVPIPPVDLRVEALLKRMTLEEKVGQLAQYAADSLTGPTSTLSGGLESAIHRGEVGSLINVHGAERINALQRVAVEKSRLGIPLLIGFDTIHGYRTIFPVPLAMAASFAPDVVEKAAAVGARESEAAGIRWVFAPMVDIARDPRWGRIVEGAGEDPHLGSAMAAAAARGTGKNVLATAKHFAGYGAAQAGRDYNTVDLSERQLHDIYLPPFKAAIDAGAEAVMAAFNDLNGTPCHASQRLLGDVLRDAWGFDGIVVSDWNGIGELPIHGVARDGAHAAQRALEAGVDIDMEGSCYARHLADKARCGEISEQAIDEAVRRVLAAKIKLGLFDAPYVDPARERREILTRDNRAVALEAARKSIVLLKNNAKTLPLAPTAKTIAVVGPLADSAADMLGPWCGQGRAEDVVTIAAGIKDKVAATAPDTTVICARGCDIEGGSDEGVAEAVAAAARADVVVAVVGESAAMSGEAASRASLDLPGRQQALLRALKETGKPLVVVLVGGRPLTIPWLAEHADAIVETWFLGTEAGTATADVLFGDANPGGRLPVSFPRALGQVPIHYDARNTGRPRDPSKFSSKYLDVPNTPLYPFGFGLSYSTFAFDGLSVTPQLTDTDGEIQVQVNVTNTSDRQGDEVVQLYVRDLVASVTRPLKQLKGFRRVTLAPGEKQTVTFKLKAADLAFHNAQNERVVEPGRFQLWVGPNSSLGLEGFFELRAPGSAALTLTRSA